jgi:RNA polymerase sigma factor (sigma-70 family)
VPEQAHGPLLRFVRRLAAAPAEHGDEQLLERFLAGRDQDAAAAILRRHGPMVLAVCRRVLENAHDVEDAFQATFLVFVRQAATIRRRGVLGPWLHGVAFRVARKAQVRAARRRRRECGRAPEATCNSMPEAERRDLRHVLDEEVNRLPECYRRAVVLCYFQGHTKEQAARELGCPHGTVSTWLARARARLRTRLVRRGLGPAVALLGATSVRADIPLPLLARTLKGIRTMITGAAAIPGTVSGTAAALANGVLGAMFWTKIKAVGFLAFLAGVVAAGAAVVAWSRPTVNAAVAVATDDKPDSTLGHPKGWWGGAAKRDEYEAGTDRQVFHGGKASGYVEMKDVGDEDFGTLAQSFKADDYRGKRLRLSAWLKTKDVAGGAALWMRVDGEDKTLSFDNMEKRRVKGSNDWAKYEIVLDVPAASKDITFGLLLAGKGRAWVDDFKFEIVDDKVKSTNILEQEIPIKRPDGAEVPDKPRNLDFEEK